MAKTPCSYTREFKLEAVRLYETSDKTMAQIERELVITPYLLFKWVKQFQAEELPPFPGKGKPSDEEIHLLKREIEILKQAREILKKQWVSSPSQNSEICGHS